jgi:branched-chain amino acid transport system substrate-binding protein
MTQRSSEGISVRFETQRSAPSLLRRTAVALGLALCAATAWSFESPADGVYKDRIDWGVMMDLSGPTAASEVPWTNGVKAYIRKVNEAGGIHGRQINLLIEDDRYDTALVRSN